MSNSDEIIWEYNGIQFSGQKEVWPWVTQLSGETTKSKKDEQDLSPLFGFRDQTQWDLDPDGSRETCMLSQ